MAGKWQVQADAENCSREEFENLAAEAFRMIEKKHGIQLRAHEYSFRLLATGEGVIDVHLAMAKEV